MIFRDQIAFVGKLIDSYAETAWRKGVAGDNDRCVPVEMYAGEVDEDGWVEWRVLPSTLDESDVTGLEKEFGIEFPPLFRAYLLARFHCFDCVRSQKYDQMILLMHTPSRKPLRPLRDFLRAWQPLIDAGLLPFAEWGDGWGPMCFDRLRRGEDGECPIVWLEHELMVPLGPEMCRLRENVGPLIQPLYPSFREFLWDIFGNGGAR